MADIQVPDVSWAPGGGVYVASTTDYPERAVLTRLDSGGAELWRREIPLGPSHTIRGRIVATDPQGNAYFAGETYGAQDGPWLGNGDAFLRRYSPDGTLQWGRQFGSALFDWPTGLGVDAAGNAYVASGPWATNYGVPPAGTFTQLRRFNADGQNAWTLGVNSQDGRYPGNGSPFSSGTIVGSDGFVYSLFSNYGVLAPPPNSVTDNRAYLTKATLDGQLVWMKNLGDRPNDFALAQDSQQNLYLAMASNLIKLDSDGNTLWERNSFVRSLFSIVIGAGDRIFVAGDRELIPYLAEYDVNGNLQWDETLPANDRGRYYGLTVSGDKLIGSMVNWVGGYLAANRIDAFQLVPEPTGAALAVVAALALTFASRSVG